METKSVEVTPAIARKWLERNTINRALRGFVVETFRAALVRGEYKETHQGIAFSHTGELLDGQHRLTAISQMPETFSIRMLVTTGLDPDAFEGIDIGLKRNPSDVLRIPTGLAAVARFVAMMVQTDRVGVTPQYLVPFVAGIEAPYFRLTGFCNKWTKTWSSAAIRSAAVLQMMAGKDQDYVCITYHALNHAEFDSMSKAAQSLFRQQINGVIAGGGSYEMFYRAFRTFDPARQGMDVIKVGDPSNIMREAREIIRTNIIGDAQKKAAKPSSSVAAKKVNGGKSSRVAA